MNSTEHEIAAEIFRRKQRARRLLAGLSIAEKIRRVVAMQPRANWSLELGGYAIYWGIWTMALKSATCWTCNP